MRHGARPGRRRYRAEDPASGRVPISGGTLQLLLPDAAAAVRLAASGLLTGEVHRLRLRLDDCPDWSSAAVRAPRLGGTLRRFGWRRRGAGVVVDVAWSIPKPVHLALADLIRTVLRSRAWDQLSGPVAALDRAAWLDGSGTWPQGRLLGDAADYKPDAEGRPLGPYVAPKPPGGRRAPPPLVTALANPYGRTLLGRATAYRLDLTGRAPVLRDDTGGMVLRLPPGAGGEPGRWEAAVASARLVKYAVVTVHGVPAPAAETPPVLRALAACGLVFTAADAGQRERLAGHGVVMVDGPGEVDDLRGYAYSVAAARRAAVTGDAALRRTRLAGAHTLPLPLPTVSVLVASMRPDTVGRCLAYLADQDYPELEILVGLHSYDVPDETARRWRELTTAPLRVYRYPAGQTLGGLLGDLTRRADGELVTKVDDDDHYGPHHVTDLVTTWHTIGADLVAKGARFVYLPELDRTIDRTWAAPEGFDVSPAGGTLLLSRGNLARVGGWSHSSRHVDEDLLVRVRDAGGVTYRTHALEYAYVRRSSGHTFATGTERLLGHAGRVYPGLPEALLRPEV